jgi:acetylornithine/succinyldiaminopimelate/putrescine aminotransferase
MSLIGQQTKGTITKQFAEHVSSGKVEFFSQSGIDFIIGKREGIFIWDIDGFELINCHSNGGVFNLGHRNPRVIAALQRALEELDIGNHHFVSEARALLAHRLASISPGDLNRVVFGVSGGEAIDMALKIARAHTGKSGVISAIGGYHGHTGLALAAGDESFRKPFGKLAPGFIQIPFGDIESLEEAINEDTAAVIFETIPATFGIAIPPADFYKEVRQLCDRSSVVLIMDEVQNGLGRCGTIWGIDSYEVVPDILVTGKGLSGGIYPVTATIYRDHLNPFLHENPFIHVSTFGGAEVGCYAALEVLNILEEPGFLEHVQKMAALFKAGFEELQTNHPLVMVEARQKGLMMGLKMSSDQMGPLMTRIGFEAGLLTIYANNDPSVVQILPPLIIQEDEVRMVLGILDGMLGKVEQMTSQ